MRHTAARALPPGPPLPAPAQSVLWLSRPIELLERCARRYGDTFTLRLAGFPPLVVTGDPDIVRDVFAGDPNRLHAGESNVILRPIVGSSSLLLLDGDRHRVERKRLTPPFHGERMQAYGREMRETARAAIDRFPLDRATAFHPVMQDIALTVILKTVFGLSDGPRFEELQALLRKLLAFGEHPSLLLLINRDGDIRFDRLQRALGRFSPWQRFRRYQERIDEILFAEIAARRRRSGGEDVLSMLIAVRDEDGRPMSDVELRDEMTTMLIAGHETTATALTWVMNRLLEHPEVCDRARADAARGSYEYLDAVIKETLRLHPIVPMVGRLTKAPQTLGGLELPDDVIIAPNIYLVHRNPTVWPDPERFDPTRFMNTKVAPHHFIAFGGGVRKCIGMAFALYEMRLVLAELLTGARFERAPGYRPRLVRRGITFTLAKGLPVIRRK